MAGQAWVQSLGDTNLSVILFSFFYFIFSSGESDYSHMGEIFGSKYAKILLFKITRTIIKEKLREWFYLRTSPDP